MEATRNVKESLMQEPHTRHCIPCREIVLDLELGPATCRNGGDRDKICDTVKPGSNKVHVQRTWFFYSDRSSAKTSLSTRDDVEATGDMLCLKILWLNSKVVDQPEVGGRSAVVSIHEWKICNE